MEAVVPEIDPYWNTLSGHDLTLMVAGGRLWKFRATGAEKVLDARLQRDALVVTRSSCGGWDDIDTEVARRLVRFTCVRGSVVLRSEVVLPTGLGLDRDAASVCRRDGVVEVRVPLAAAAAEEPAVALAVQAA